jgi:hypothetical protein
MLLPEHIMRNAEKRDVKGGLVLEQLIKYAKLMSDATRCSCNVQIDIWYHRSTVKGIKDGHHVEFTVYNSGNREFYRPIGEHTDIRQIGLLIGNIIQSQ